MKKIIATMSTIVAALSLSVMVAPAAKANHESLNYTRSITCNNGATRILIKSYWEDNGGSYHDLDRVDITQQIATGRTWATYDWATSMTVAHRISGVNKEVSSVNPNATHTFLFPKDFWSTASAGEMYLNASGSGRSCGPIIDTAV